MLESSQTTEAFERLLAEAGFEHRHPEPQRAWAAFKGFAAMPVVCAEDALLFQCGTWDFTGREQFHFDFTRQFTYEKDGEYAGMEQFHCTLYFAPTAELRPLATTLWSLDVGSLPEFFARVEALPEFRMPMALGATAGADISLEAV